MKIFRWLGLAALALTVGSNAQAADIKIGVVLPFSGPNADLGHQIDKAFDL
jgi:ABC-type branched-subunit amino acid transport system substrate-binding protein